MKKLIAMLGIAVGFIFGSRAGRGPYEQVEAKLKKVRRRKDVKHAVSTVRATASDKLDEVKNVVDEKIHDGVSAVKKRAAR
jgi:hypothetical protein